MAQPLLILLSLCLALLQLLCYPLPVCFRQRTECLSIEHQILVRLDHFPHECLQAVVDGTADFAILHHGPFAVEAVELQLFEGESEACFAERMSAWHDSGSDGEIAFRAHWAEHFFHSM